MLDTITLSPACSPDEIGVVVSDRVPESDRGLLRHPVPVLLTRHKNETLPALPRDRKHWHHRHRLVLQITRAFTICALRRISGVACTGAFTRIPCSVLSTCGEMKSIFVFSSRFHLFQADPPANPSLPAPPALWGRKCRLPGPCSRPPWLASWPKKRSRPRAPECPRPRHRTARGRCNTPVAPAASYLTPPTIRSLPCCSRRPAQPARRRRGW